MQLPFLPICESFTLLPPHYLVFPLLPHSWLRNWSLSSSIFPPLRLLLPPVQCCSYFQVFLHHHLLPIKRGEEDAGVVAHWQPYPDLSSATTPAFSRSSPVQQETTLRARARTSGVAPLPATRQDYQPTKTAFMDEAESHSTKDEYHPWGACMAYVIWLSSLILFPALFGSCQSNWLCESSWCQHKLCCLNPVGHIVLTWHHCVHGWRSIRFN